MALFQQQITISCTDT